MSLLSAQDQGHPGAAIEEPEQNWIEEGPGVAFDDELFEEKSSIDAGLELWRLQRVDPSLGHIWETITSQEDKSLNRFMEQDGLLWRRGQNMVNKEECQRTAQKRHKPAPLIPLPVIDEPFRCIVMDIVGPLPRSSSGDKYILVVCDYATRYPEAVAMKSVMAEYVAEELISIFARVGIPQEILTDQGSNFMSNLLAELYRLLQIKPIRTSPYHPVRKKHCKGSCNDSIGYWRGSANANADALSRSIVLLEATTMPQKEGEMSGPTDQCQMMAE